MDNTIEKPKILTREEYDNDFMPNLPKGVCPFCSYEQYQIVLKDGYSWYWAENLAPCWRWHTLLVPKRHFDDFFDMDRDEWWEMKNLLNYATGVYRSLGLKRSDGNEVEKFIYSWRKRDNLFDPISKTYRVSHWHLQITPDKDHLYDPIIEKDASKYTISLLLK